MCRASQQTGSLVITRNGLTNPVLKNSVILFILSVYKIIDTVKKYEIFIATVTAVFHNQYNTPIGMYSDSNVFQEFQNQTKGLMADLNNNNNNKQNSSESTTSSFQNTNYLQHLSQKQNPVRGANSLSMRMLNTGIQEVEGTNSKSNNFL